jgi:hypothetical protein
MERHSPHHKPGIKKDANNGQFGGRSPLLDMCKHEATAPGLFSKEEWREMAQMIIDEKGLRSGDEFARFDWELYSGALAAGVVSSLKFRENAEAGALPMTAMVPEELRKASLKGAEIDNCTMFKLIMVECFHIGTGRPVVGVHRTTQTATLQNTMNRKLSGPQHREFKRCWSRMVSEGVIQMTKDKNAAHLNVTFDGICDMQLKKAVTWAIKEQMKISPEWRGRYEQMLRNP